MSCVFLNVQNTLRTPAQSTFISLQNVEIPVNFEKNNYIVSKRLRPVHEGQCRRFWLKLALIYGFNKSDNIWLFEMADITQPFKKATDIKKKQRKTHALFNLNGILSILVKYK